MSKGFSPNPGRHAVRSRSMRLLANGKSLVVVHVAGRPSEEHKLSFLARTLRREDNKTMKLRHKSFRRRKKHGRQ